MSGELVELTRGGRLASVLCRLARSGFTGLVYAEHDDGSLAISVRDGRPVFVEDFGGQQSIPDALLEQGLVSKEQYAAIATRVLESLADNEDVAFCQVAIDTRVLTRAQVDAELARRMRGRLIRAIAWEQCRIELDDDPDSVTGQLEYPQDVGALIYMGVRTFFDEDRVRALIGPEPVHYARLLRPIAEALDFFQLEPDEAALLAHLQPDVQLGPTIEDNSLDALDGWQLVCMLLLAEMIELQAAPFPTTAERSGVRTTRGVEPGATRRDSSAREPAAGTGSQFGMPAVREEQIMRGSQARMPAAREEYVRPASRPRMPVPREDPAEPGSGARMPAPREEHVGTGSRPRMPVPRQERAAQPSHARVGGGVDDRAAQPAPAAPQAARTMPGVERAPSARQQPAQPAARAQASAPQAPASASSPAAQTAPAAEAGTRRRPVHKLGTALQRLDRELKQVRGAQPSAPQPAAQAAAAAQEGGHGRAHVEQLLRMRASALAQKQAPTQNESKAVEEFRLGQEALRDQQFGRAFEHLRKACEGEPNNEVYAMFCMWASFRANTLQGEGINKLRTALRERVSDDEYKSFAYYALGHISLVEKRDDLAEKFFRKAIELDKHNKDAERHLRIIELRRKTAASEQRANKIFGIEIGIKKS